MLPAARKYGIEVPDRGLACAPVESREGLEYYAAMACAVNFAFANRQLITHDVRCAFGDVLQRNPADLGLQLVYDVAHNIAKWETHKGQKVLVHRKGATRALPPGHWGNPPLYFATGHPVLVPGSMGTASYVLTGTEKAAETLFSQSWCWQDAFQDGCNKSISREQFEQSMDGVIYNSRNYMIF